jgi:hypothetical protein
MRNVAPEDHVTSGLAAEHKTGPFQHGTYLATGQVNGELGHELELRDFDFSEFLVGFRRHDIAGFATVF